MNKIMKANLTAGKLLSSAWASRHGFMSLFWILMVPYMIISGIISGSVPIIGSLTTLLVVGPMGQAGFLVVTHFHLKKQAWDKNNIIEIFNSNKIYEILKANVILSGILYIPPILFYLAMDLFMTNESMKQLFMIWALILGAYYLILTAIIMLMNQLIIFEDYSALEALKVSIHILRQHWVSTISAYLMLGLTLMLLALPMFIGYWFLDALYMNDTTMLIYAILYIAGLVLPCIGLIWILPMLYLVPGTLFDEIQS